MKELGEYLRETREENGVSLEEAAQDLEVDLFLLESVEEGNVRAFKDIMVMKRIVTNYAKYIGLETEKVIDDFNDYMFEKTSKISFEDILKAEKELKSKKEVISSPFTIVKPKKDYKKFLITFGGFIVIILLILLIFELIRPKQEIITNELKDLRIRGDLVELTK